MFLARLFEVTPQIAALNLDRKSGCLQAQPVIGEQGGIERCGPVVVVGNDDGIGV